MFTGVLLLVVAGGLFWLAYRRPQPRRWWLPRPAARLAPAGAAVDRQHRHLRAGGLIGEAAFESTRARFRDLLDSGRTAEVEGELRGGLAFAVQVRALAEIGTPQAAAVLERLLGRPLTRDRVEQSWYWADVAAALRALGRPTALPAVLRRADETAGLPQGVLLAAEAVGFPNFAALLRPPADPAAVRALARAARGCRDGTADPAALLRAGLGDHLAAVSESAPPSDDPWLTAAVLEAERVSRRLEHWARLLPAEVRPLAERQAQRLEVSAERRAGWLGGAARRLADRFPLAPAGERAAALAVLGELRADVAGLFPALPDRRAAWWADAVRALAWSRSAVVGPVLAVQATALLRSRRSRPHAAVLLGALRGHRCEEAERALLAASTTTDPAVRRAAAESLGWWDPFDPAAVLTCLRTGRAEADPGVRRAATGALARLGDRAAVEEFAGALAGEEPAIRQSAALAVAEEGLTWLWPDLQAVADSSDPDTALAAAESLERLREHLFGPLG